MTEPVGPLVIRDGLRQWLAARGDLGPDALFVGELGLCQGGGRIDLAVVSGELHGYEIKSDNDGLGRLGGQIQRYGLVFDRLTLVSGRRHLPRALELVPGWWGVVRARATAQGVVFTRVRKGRRNVLRNSRALAEFLWREEAYRLLQEVGAARGLSNSARAYLWDRLSEVLTVDEMAAAVRSHVRETVLAGKRGVLL